MTLYFFDIDDGSEVVKDTEGSPHPGLAAAQLEATETLAQMAREIFPGAKDKSLTIDIREDSGPAVLRVMLHLSTTAL